MQNINVFSFLWKFLRNRKLFLTAWIILQILKDFMGIFIAQYFNKKAINYFQSDNITLINGLTLIFLYAVFNNSSIMKIFFS